jgi:hypothetical protein
MYEVDWNKWQTKTQGMLIEDNGKTTKGDQMKGSIRMSFGSFLSMCLGLPHRNRC